MVGDSYYVRGAADNDGHRGKNSVSFAVTQCVVHCRSEQRETEAGQRAQECNRRKSYDNQGGVSKETNEGETDITPEAAYNANESMTYV